MMSWIRIFVAAVMTAVAAVLIVAIVKSNGPEPDWQSAVLNSDSTYYYLGRNAGTLAYATLELRRIRTGRDFSTKELYDLADSMSDFHNQIEGARKILEGGH
jgi:hypothetical protein